MQMRQAREACAGATGIRLLADGIELGFSLDWRRQRPLARAEQESPVRADLPQEA